MPQCCAVPKCSNKKGGHRFPKDEIRKKKWLAAICRDFTPSKHSLVCKNHFREDDYELPKDSVYDTPRLKLKQTAVPSIFPSSEANNINNTKVTLSTNVFVQEKSSSPNSPETSVSSSTTGNSNITHLSHNELRNKYICLDHFKEEFVRNKGGKRTRLTKKSIPKHYQQEENNSPSPIPSTSRDNSPEIKMELPKKVYPVVYRSNVEIEEPSGLLVQVDSPKERKISSDEDTINTNSLAHKRKSARLKNKKIDFFEMPLSNAEKCKNYRNRKKKDAPPKTKTPKTSAERCRMYRLRKIQLAQGSQLSANEVLNTPIDSIPYHTDIAVENKYLKEKPKKPHDHVLRRLRDDQYSCDVCHETFTRVSKQKNITVGPDATPGPAIKQEKEAIDDNVECREFYKQGAPESVNGICGIKIESVKTEATHPEQSVNDLPVPPAAIKQEYEIKTEYIEIEVKKEIIEESFMEEVE